MIKRDTERGRINPAVVCTNILDIRSELLPHRHRSRSCSTELHWRNSTECNIASYIRFSIIVAIELNPFWSLIIRKNVWWQEKEMPTIRKQTEYTIKLPHEIFKESIFTMRIWPILLNFIESRTFCLISIGMVAVKIIRQFEIPSPSYPYVASSSTILSL